MKTISPHAPGPRIVVRGDMYVIPRYDAVSRNTRAGAPTTVYNAFSPSLDPASVCGVTNKTGVPPQRAAPLQQSIQYVFYLLIRNQASVNCG